MKLFTNLISAIANRLPFGVLGCLTYQGHRFRLRRPYLGELAYSLDYENNLASGEPARIEGVMCAVPFGPVFESKVEIFAALERLRFPGYGYFYANQRSGAAAEKHEFMSVALPGRGKRRYLVVEEVAKDKFLVVADFIAEDCAAVRARLDGERVELLSRAGEVLKSEPRA